MKTFGIAELVRFSGVKAHTLRTWELRYGVPKPLRSEKNTRSYSLNEVKRVLSIALLSRYGFKISKLTGLSEEERMQRLHGLPYCECHYLVAIHKMLFCMYSMDAEGFERTVNDCFFSWRPHIVICSIIDPFLKLTQLFWQGNRLVEEHQVVTILRKKIILSIEQLATVSQKNKTVLLFLNGSRQLDLLLLYAYYLLKYSSIKVVYLGNDVSVDNLSILFDTIQPDFLYTYFPAANDSMFKQLDTIMNEKLPGGKLLISLQKDTATEFHASEQLQLTDFNQAIDIMCRS